MEHVTEQQLTRRQSTVWRALRAAAPQTIPVLAGYFVLGMGYGIYVQSLGLPVWMPMLMGTVVYGGSLEFVLASLLLSAFSPLSAFLMALMIQARHLFYGLAMLERYKGYGLRSFYMIFAMILSCLQYLLMVFASGSIGQLFTKHKVGASIGAGIVFYMSGQIVSSIILVLTGYFGVMNNVNVVTYNATENVTFSTTVSSMLFSGSLFSIIECVIFYIVCMVIIKKHLNLE